MRAVMALAGVLALGACATKPPVGALVGNAFSEPELQKQTPSLRTLQSLPVPQRAVPVAVYSFTDQTGQFRLSETGQTLSRAVSQGGAAILIKALQDAGRRSWFTVVERENLSNLLNERQIIREMRERYLGETQVNPEALPSLLFAGVILGGGVIGYDSNTLTGGAGAGFLGVSARTEYRQDTVTVSLRAVSVRTGEVLATVTTSKTIASYAVGGGAFRYVGFKELLEAETGFTTNEPDQLALQQAIEKAVYALIMEGVDLQLWNFADTAKGGELVESYRSERDGRISPEQAARARRKLLAVEAAENANPTRSRSRLDAGATQVGPAARRTTAMTDPEPSSRGAAAAGANAPAIRPGS
jgi:curli production assembly/transport component CsgG